jgi:hypothetical protein
MRREQLPDCLEVAAALLSPEARKGVSAVRMNARCQRAKKDAPDGSAARRPPNEEKETQMIILGVVLLVVGFVTGIPVLVTIGGILLVIGVILWILGTMGRAVGGRKHYY